MADRSWYWKEYNQKNRERVHQKSQRQAARQKAARHQEFEGRPHCAICGKPFTGRAIASSITLAAGVHQKCDPARWNAERRRKA